MPEVEPLIRVVRELALDVAAACRDALLAGVPIERVQGHYFRRMQDLADEADAQALLATGGSAEAVAAIEGCLAALAALADELAAEMAQAAGEESDD